MSYSRESNKISRKEFLDKFKKTIRETISPSRTSLMKFLSNLLNFQHFIYIYIYMIYIYLDN